MKDIWGHLSHIYSNEWYVSPDLVINQLNVSSNRKVLDLKS